MVYFPPCHQREQQIGMPYLDLLQSNYGEAVSAIRGDLYCCGMAGIMGFKRDFHESSRKLGQGLLDQLMSHRLIGVMAMYQSDFAACCSKK